MIPYFRFTIFVLGPVHIQVWGLFVALGIAVAILVGRHVAGRRGLDKEAFTDLASWIVIGALIGARLFHVFAYAPAVLLADPLSLLRIWEGGMSMFGGLLGGAAVALLYARHAKLAFMAYADLTAYVLPLGYGIGRIGCFLIHDHPGTLSHSFLAVLYPGGARLDHGLLLSLAGFVLFAAFAAYDRKKGRAARFLPAYMVCYGSLRFFLDFYRARDLVGSDVRYFALTPSQYLAIALIVAGAFIWHRRQTLYALPPERRP